MKRIRYSKYVPDPAGEMSMEDLLSALSDYLLQSGFQSDMWYEMPEGEQTLDDLKRALEQALMEGDQFRRRNARTSAANGGGRPARRTHRKADRAHAAGRLHLHRSATRSVPPVGRRRPGRRKPAAGQIRNHRQEPRLPRLQIPAQPARLARQIQFWTPRHSRPRHRHRSQRILEDL